MKRVTEPDMSTYLGINLDPILGPLFWGTFHLCQSHLRLLIILVGTLISMV